MRTIILIIVAYCLIGINIPASAQWQYSHYDIYPDQMFDCACVDSSTFWAVGSFGYVIKSTDSGRSWSPFSYAHLTDNLRKVDFPDPAHGFAASQTGVTVIASNDSGNTWQIVCQNLLLNRISGMKFADSLNGYISGANTIYRTADGGHSWLSPDSFISGLVSLGIVVENKDTVWACGGTGNDPYFPKIIRTTDGGHIWNVVSTLGDTLDGAIRAISFSDLNHGWAEVSLTHSYSGFLYATSDRGNSWNLINIFNDGPSSHVFNNIVALDSLNIRIAGDSYIGGSIRRSTDGGYNWTFEWIGYSGLIRGFSMSDSTHGLVVGGPIWDNTPLILYYDNSTGIPENDNSAKPMAFELSAYPNPFNSSVSISYSNVHGSEIGIYDIIGQRIRTFQVVGMKGQVIWNGTDDNDNPVSSGVYFARMKTSLRNITVKLVLIK
jgi:photosystem II stability/assembly factor-like uncharacterized protein